MDLDAKQHMDERNRKTLDDKETLIKDFGMHGTDQGGLEIIAQGAVHVDLNTGKKTKGPKVMRGDQMTLEQYF